MELIEFLLARIAEDEAVAQSIGLDPRSVFRRYGGSTVRWIAAAGERPWVDARSRVLAECEAKRRIVTECGWVTVMQLLALPYAGHPDYRQEWKP
jgi:hypothetical protein